MSEDLDRLVASARRLPRGWRHAQGDILRVAAADAAERDTDLAVATGTFWADLAAIAREAIHTADVEEAEEADAARTLGYEIDRAYTESLGIRVVDDPDPDP